MNNPIFRRYLKMSSLCTLAGIILILSFTFIQFMAINDNYKNMIEFIDKKENYEDLEVDTYHITAYEKGSNHETQVYYDTDICFNKGDKIIRTGFFIIILLNILLNILSFNDENKKFMKVLPVKKEYIYLYRSIFSIVSTIIMSYLMLIIVSNLYEYNFKVIKSILENFINIGEIMYSDSDALYIFWISICASSFFPFLNTIFSKPIWSCIAGVTGIIVILCGMKGFASFSDLYLLSEHEAIYNFLIDVADHLLSRRTLFIFTIIFLIAGTWLYKIGKEENRRSFFMFSSLKTLCYAFGSIFGGFAFFIFFKRLYFFNTITNNNIILGISIVLAGGFTAFFIIKKVLDICE